MKNYSSQLRNQPQTRPIFGRTDMVKNNAGGYVFQITPKEQLERFLLLGTEGGTYYTSEQKLTVDNATSIVSLIKIDGKLVVETVKDFLLNNRAPKVDASLFVLALCATYGDASTKALTYTTIPQVLKTATQMFMFVANIKNLRGWSRGLRKAVAQFYLNRDTAKLAYQIVKYRNRAGFTHRDVLRLTHPKTNQQFRNELFKYAVGKSTEAESSFDLIKTFGKAQTATPKELVTLLQNNPDMTWEMIPTEHLNNTAVLTALVDNMPLTALIRNLNRFSYNGLTDVKNEVVKKIMYKLTNAEEVKKSKIHPLNVINSLFTYSKGRGDKGNKTWTPNQGIVDALCETYELALTNVEATGKNILVAVDVSGSMTQGQVGTMAMNASQIANVLALTMLKTEKNTEVINFDTALQPVIFGKRSSIDEVIRITPNGGGTDCSVPLRYAVSKQVKYDAIVILTDNETWAGQQHGLPALELYRKTVNPNVKVIEIAMTANPYSTLPSDKNLLRIVGFDSTVVNLINKFI